MGGSQDLTGQRFGKLIVLNIAERKSCHWYWRCKCDCGNEKDVRESSLRNGLTKSCGCLKTGPHGPHGPFDKSNLTGKKFAKLTVLKPTEKRSNGQVVYLCKCDCGNEIFVSSWNLKNGNTKSCGCLRNPVTVGDVFGELRVVKKEGRRSICICERCGREFPIESSSLKSRKNPTCGCVPVRRRCGPYGPSVKGNLTGKKFAKLTVLKPTDKRANGRVVYLCKCDCGNEIFVSSSNLKSGKTKSCGCLKTK